MSQRNPFLQGLQRARALMTALCLSLCASPPSLAGVDVDIRGVDDTLKANVLAYLSFERYKKNDDLSADTIERLHNRVEREVQSALRPFGYYKPSVHTELTEVKRGDWRETIEINPDQ